MEKPISAWQGMTEEQRAKQLEYHRRYNEKVKADPEKYERLKAQRRQYAKKRYLKKREELLEKANRRYREAHGLPVEDGIASESMMQKRINMQMESKQKQLAELIDSIEALRQKAEAEKERVKGNALRKVSVARERQKLKEKKGDPPPCFPVGSLTWDLKDAVLYKPED
jgi:hypothetical protein